MISLSRIKSSIVHLGNHYMVGKTENKQENQQDEILISTQKQAEEILNAANAEAARIIDEAQTQVQETLQQSREEGFQTGYKTGYDESFKKIQEDFIRQIKSIDMIAQSAYKVKKEIISSSELEILQLTIAIAEKIVKQQLETSPETILSIVRAVIHELKDKEEIKIIVNPVHVEYLYNFSEELKNSINGLESVKIIKDKTIPIDGIIVESGESRIDARLETQIAQITKHLLNEAAENPTFAEIPKEIEIKIEEPPCSEL